MNPAALQSVLQNWALPNSSLDLDFVHGRGAYFRKNIARTSLLSASRTTTSSVGSYATWADGHLSWFADNTLRITDQGLLVEQAATNLLIGNQITGNNATTGTSAIVGPDGTSFAFFITEDTSSPGSGSGHEVYANTSGITVTANTIYTSSVYLKAGARTKARLYWTTSGVGSGVYVAVDLSAGTIGSATAFGTGTATTATVSKASNGFWRVSVTGKLDAASTTGYFVVMTCDGTGTPYYTGDGASGIYGFLAQTELGSFPTSPIPTTSAAVTRGADVVTLNSALIPLFNKGTGTILAVTNQLMGNLGTDSPSLVDGDDASNNWYLRVYDATHVGSKTANINLSSTIGASGNYATGRVKSGLTWNASARAIAANGGTVATDAHAPTTTASVTLMGPTAQKQPNGYMERFALIPANYSPAQLQALTTP